MIGQPRMPFGIAQQDARARIRQAIFQFLPRPPGIERHHDGTDRRSGKKGHRPFGQVAHGEANPIPLADAERQEMPGERGGGAVKIGIAHPLLFQDGERRIAMGARQLGQGRQGGRHVFPCADRLPGDRLLHHFKPRARRTELGFDIGERGGRPGSVRLCIRHSGPFHP